MLNRQVILYISNSYQKVLLSIDTGFFTASLSVLYGLVFTFCLYKNLHGSTFPICVGATIGFSVMLLHKIDFKLVRQSVPYMTGMILLGISTAYTSSFFFHFFNIFGIILLFCVFMIRQFYNDHTWNFRDT